MIMCEALVPSQRSLLGIFSNEFNFPSVIQCRWGFSLKMCSHSGVALGQTAQMRVIEFHIQFTCCFFCLIFFDSMNFLRGPVLQSCLSLCPVSEATFPWSPTLATLSFLFLVSLPLPSQLPNLLKLSFPVVAAAVPNLKGQWTWYASI